MKLDNLQDNLIAAARTIKPDGRVPYAFEKRILALVASATDPWTVWSRALWRAAVSCLAVVTLCGAWTLWSQHRHGATDFSQEFESAVFASASPDEV